MARPRGRWQQDADLPEGRLGPIERFGEDTSGESPNLRERDFRTLRGLRLHRYLRLTIPLSAKELGDPKRWPVKSHGLTTFE